MGIKSLFKMLKPIEKKNHLKNFKGMKMGIDTYCWLHKAVYVFAEEIASNEECTKYLIILKRMLKLLLKYEIIPIFVFDGAPIPIKNCEENKREYRRQKVKEEIKKAQLQGIFLKYIFLKQKIAFI